MSERRSGSQLRFAPDQEKHSETDKTLLWWGCGRRSMTHALSRQSPWTPVSMETTLGFLPGGRSRDVDPTLSVHAWKCACAASATSCARVFCVWARLFTSFWWWTSYSVLCLSSVSIRSSGIASIFIPVTGRGEGGEGGEKKKKRAPCIIDGDRHFLLPTAHLPG